MHYISDSVMSLYIRHVAKSLKDFSSLFTVNSDDCDDKYREALNILGLGVLIDFESVEENCSQVLKTSSYVKDGPEGSVVVDVPPFGDCWLLALLAPLLGYVVKPKDDLGIVKHVREKLSKLVGERPEDFEDIFEDRRQGVLRWMETVKVPGTWGGDDEFEIFTRLTGIVVHVIDGEHQTVSSLSNQL